MTRINNKQGDLTEEQYIKQIIKNTSKELKEPIEQTTKRARHILGIDKK